MADITPLKKELNEQFKDLTPRQMWAIVKLCKWVRLRARNNSAFNNVFNTIFGDSGFSFREVTKTKKDGTTYPGLQISLNGQVDENNESED